MVVKRKTVRKSTCKPTKKTVRKSKGKWLIGKRDVHINVKGSKYTTLPDGQKTALDAPLPYGIKPIKRKKTGKWGFTKSGKWKDPTAKQVAEMNRKHEAEEKRKKRPISLKKYKYTGE